MCVVPAVSVSFKDRVAGWLTLKGFVLIVPLSAHLNFVPLGVFGACFAWGIPAGMVVVTGFSPWDGCQQRPE